MRVRVRVRVRVRLLPLRACVEARRCEDGELGVDDLDDGKYTK